MIYISYESEQESISIPRTYPGGMEEEVVPADFNNDFNEDFPI